LWLSKAWKERDTHRQSTPCRQWRVRMEGADTRPQPNVKTLSRLAKGTCYRSTLQRNILEFYSTHGQHFRKGIHVCQSQRIHPTRSLAERGRKTRRNSTPRERIVCLIWTQDPPERGIIKKLAEEARENV